MNKKLGKNDMADSQAAIMAYISYREENGYRHKARVLISSKGKNRYNNIIPELFISFLYKCGAPHSITIIAI